jgi:protein phosphatase PTC2/3
MGKKFEEKGKGENKYLSYGYSSKQGVRQTHEDRHDTEVHLKEDDSLSFFGVYDGHGGDEAADYIKKNLLTNLMKIEDYNEQNLQEGFLQTDKLMRGEDGFNDSFSGTTAVCCLIQVIDEEVKLVCANLGDSRCVFYKNEEVLPLSIDQKPNKPKEKKRIEESGSCVMFGRVNGSLAVSRAFGDFKYKNKENLKPEEQSVIALPEITNSNFKIGTQNCYMVLACDGLWDVLKNEGKSTFLKLRCYRFHIKVR